MLGIVNLFWKRKKYVTLVIEPIKSNKLILFKLGNKKDDDNNNLWTIVFFKSDTNNLGK